MKRLTAELDPLFPGTSELVNRELVQLLIYLQARDVVAKSLKQMADAKTQQDAYHYLFHLRTVPIGWWTLDQRKEYLSWWKKDRKKLPYSAEFVKWFAVAGRPARDGASFANYVKHILERGDRQHVRRGSARNWPR